MTSAGPAATDIAVSDNIHLSVRDPDTLAAKAKSVSTPGSPDYGKYTVPGRLQAENQLGTGQVARIRAWLTSAGLAVSRPNWRMVRVTGTLGQFADAFGVTFGDRPPPSSRRGHRNGYPIGR